MASMVTADNARDTAMLTAVAVRLLQAWGNNGTVMVYSHHHAAGVTCPLPPVHAPAGDCPVTGACHWLDAAALIRRRLKVAAMAATAMWN